MTTDADVERVTDVLGEPYLAETIPLPPDDEGEVVATLVRRTAAGPTDQGGAARARLLPTTSSRPGTPTGGPSAATTSTRSTCASTAAPCVRTRRPTTSPTCATTTPRSTRPGSGSPSATATPRSSSRRTPPAASIVGLWADDRRPAELAGAVHELPLAGPAGQRRCSACVGTPIAQADRRPPADARDQAARDRPLHAQPAPRPRRRVGLQPRCGSRSSRSRSTPAGCAPIREGHARLHRGLTLPLPRARPVVGALDAARGDGRGRARHRHRARRRPDPALGDGVRPARHLRRHRGRPPRRGPLP